MVKVPVRLSTHVVCNYAKQRKALRQQITSTPNATGKPRCRQAKQRRIASKSAAGLQQGVTDDTQRSDAAAANAPLVARAPANRPSYPPLSNLYGREDENRESRSRQASHHGISSGNPEA